MSEKEPKDIENQLDALLKEFGSGAVSRMESKAPAESGADPAPPAQKRETPAKPAAAKASAKSGAANKPAPTTPPAKAPAKVAAKIPAPEPELAKPLLSAEELTLQLQQMLTEASQIVGQAQAAKPAPKPIAESVSDSKKRPAAAIEPADPEPAGTAQPEIPAKPIVASSEILPAQEVDPDLNAPAPFQELSIKDVGSGSGVLNVEELDLNDLSAVDAAVEDEVTPESIAQVTSSEAPDDADEDPEPSMSPIESLVKTGSPITAQDEIVDPGEIGPGSGMLDLARVGSGSGMLDMERLSEHVSPVEALINRDDALSGHDRPDSAMEIGPGSGMLDISNTGSGSGMLDLPHQAFDASGSPMKGLMDEQRPFPIDMPKADTPVGEVCGLDDLDTVPLPGTAGAVASEMGSEDQLWIDQMVGDGASDPAARGVPSKVPERVRLSWKQRIESAMHSIWWLIRIALVVVPHRTLQVLALINSLIQPLPPMWRDAIGFIGMQFCFGAICLMSHRFLRLEWVLGLAAFLTLPQIVIFYFLFVHRNEQTDPA